MKSEGSQDGNGIPNFCLLFQKSLCYEVEGYRAGNQQPNSPRHYYNVNSVSFGVIGRSGWASVSSCLEWVKKFSTSPTPKIIRF
jgi:hypothetical protein